MDIHGREHERRGALSARAQILIALALGAALAALCIAARAKLEAHIEKRIEAALLERCPQASDLERLVLVVRYHDGRAHIGECMRIASRGQARRDREAGR